MSKVGAIMTMGKQSLMNNQTALQTVSHNIANKSTEGFSRQRVDFQANDAVGWGKTRQGTGAHVGRVQRTNNSYLEKQIETESNKLGNTQARAEGMARVEQIFNEQDSPGLNRFVSDFFNSFREFSNNPESAAARTLVKETASAASKDFGRASRQLKGIQEELDNQLKSQVDEINGYTHEIAALNRQIQMVESSGGVANDERDRRDVIVKQLGNMMNIRASAGDDGQLNITAGNTAILVSGNESLNLEASATQSRGDKRDGAFDLFYITGTKEPIRITEQITGGAVGAAFEIRDKVINGLREKLDLLAYTVTKNVNQVHMSGFNKYNQTGIQFFKDLNQIDDAASRIQLSGHVFEDVNNIAAAASEKSPGDNRVAIVIAGLQNQGLLENGQTTLDDYYNGMVGQLAVSTKKANSVHEHQKNVFEQLKNVRESISGVSLDEEAIKMIEFQKAYDASAKMIKTADEMMQTVLDLKR